MKKYNTMMIALFILSLLVFAYICYVLLKPERF
ncbi:potassium-transporting ATPase subunit F [Edaphocola flava]|nr:potassium-transporting ATPase subunit F [Edaphocola flava]